MAKKRKLKYVKIASFRLGGDKLTNIKRYDMKREGIYSYMFTVNRSRRGSIAAKNLDEMKQIYRMQHFRTLQKH